MPQGMDRAGCPVRLNAKVLDVYRRGSNTELGAIGQLTHQTLVILQLKKWRCVRRL